MDTQILLSTLRIEKATLTLIDKDILKIEIHEHSEMEVEDMKKLHEAKVKLVQGRDYYSLVIAPMVAGVSKEVREYSATPEANIGSLAKAVVSPTLGMRLIVNFFISVNKPGVPHKIFRKQEDALKWIAELKAKKQKTEFKNAH